MDKLTVADLIELLKALPQELPVVYRCYSEWVLLEPAEVKIVELSEPRPDGWVHDKRPDKPSRLYVTFPGN